MLIPSLLTLALAASAPTPPNVLILIADDLGVDQLGLYDVGTDFAPTPHLDALARRGTRFENAWSSPSCSPTRAGLLTGRFGFRTGIGEVITSNNMPLPLVERTLPEALDAAAPVDGDHALLGKWHLGNSANGGNHSPNLAGFDHFAGSIFGMFHATPSNQYFQWTRITNGQTSLMAAYNTTVTVNDALSWISSRTVPWLCVVSFCAPHQPFHAPPTSLHTQSLPVTPPQQTPRPYFKAMIEAMDTEIGRLLAGLGPEASETVVVFIGDNGTPASVVAPPIASDRAKGTVYEGGVRVPLLVAGPGVERGRECRALVQTLDLYATALELLGVPSGVATVTPIDSISLVPHLDSPGAPGGREHLFAEVFHPNGPPGASPSSGARAIRGARFKLVRTFAPAGTWEELFDLVRDPLETTDLLSLATVPPRLSDVRRRLAAELDARLDS